MPLITNASYSPPAYLWNGHLQTIIPSVFRKIPVAYRRERITTPDDDFLDVDWCLSSAATPAGGLGQRPLVILSHGLEGDSTRQYLAGMVRQLTAHGFDCLAWNYRSCSGEMNKLARFYHIGETDDLEAVVQYALGKGYAEISLVGFSAGGNISLKYLGERGEQGLHPAIKKAVAVSVPLDLMTTADRLEAWDSMLYNIRFQNTLKEKIRVKSPLLPEAIRTVDMSRIRSLREFDDLITAPLHGFGNVENYYRVNSSLPFLSKITVPTLVLNARNDPFLSRQCLPDALAKELSLVWMEFPKQGGHCGFTTKKGLQAPNYAEERALAFLTAIQPSPL
ncbi:alpha/beta fold hydrolase [Fibrella sp. HMF5335]|uniref:Alpha/beta fold hydrolase n=1 Tax=Fibrella rubiginis TaxID=2817060 RepID=A0A939GGN8_9BACT|nr:alpha/beta fold hydrolase [Fibrella rubiginis]MBO0936884.1 alpha/beta fold hydrolase [Fibrella rubiginis]